ncbi:MarR family transcriptional regulator [Nocardiopsis rhodophaea]|uniref:MarR family transcriptional regulator n=1 Tax=Nocardiopsis rhodophaea TaxID=280238 RepID=A0ABN2T5Q2_9ACTN
MTPTRDVDLASRWRELLARYHTLSCALDRALQEGHGIGMSDFEALDLLIDADHEKLRMQDLAAGMYLSQSALSRTIARLESRGLVTRAMCSDDRRAVFVAPTDSGRALHTQARPTHRAVLADHLDRPEGPPRPDGTQCA